MKKHVIPALIGLTLSVFLLTTISGANAQTTGIKLLENSYDVLRLHHSLNTADFKCLKVNTPKGFFSELFLPGYNTSMTNGDPRLPVLKKLIEVPIGANVNITVKNAVFIEIPLSQAGAMFRIMPAQPSLSKSIRTGDVPFFFNEHTYQTATYLPHEMVQVVNIGIFRSLRLARLEISPVFYNPVTAMLQVCTSADVELRFADADISQTIQLKQRTYSPFFGLGNPAVLNFKPLADKSNFTKYPVKYVIVADPMFQAALQPFVEWKTKKGFKVIQAYTNDPGVGNTTTSIKAYLQNLYNSGTASDPAPSFILFVGDIAQVPAFAGTTGTHVTDLYYCEYTGDFLPEVFYGRFSATTVAELQPQIDKTMEYEQYLMPKPTFLDTCVMIAGQDPSNGPTYGDGQINYGTDTYFNAAHQLYSHTYLFAVSASSAAQIIQNVSRGVCYVNYTAHGGPDGWSDPAFSNSDVTGLQNAHRYPLMVGNCCLTNKFDEPVCFGEALLRANMKGALGYIGGSNSTYWDEDYLWAVGNRVFSGGTPPLHATYDASKLGAYDRLFHDHGEAFGEWFVTQGQMNVAGNLAVQQAGGSADYYWEIYHLMGDPSLMVYFSEPPAMAVSYNSLMPLGATSFTVTTDAPFAYVGISKSGVLCGAALADSNGVAQVSLNPITIPGTADVVVTCQNRQPYIGTVVVASPSGPYVLYEKNHVNPASGNHDTVVDFNENVSLDIILKNYGAANANGVTATLSATDPLVNITGNSHSWGTINASSTASETSAFTFTTAPHCPDQHPVLFNLSIQDNSSNTWSSNFTLKINAPELEIGQFTINDASGNNNHSLDPGETVDIVIQTLNTGHSDAPSTLGTLSCTSPFITLNNSVFNFNTLTKGSDDDAVFSITASSALPDTAVIHLIYDVNSGPYHRQNEYFISTGQATEDFETGDFSKFNWQQAGNLPWTITNVNPYEGIYCAKSGAITDDQTSELSISLNITIADTLSFWKKTSCEQGSNWGGTYYWYDNLEFFIDGNSNGKWDGISTWGKVEYPVAAGQHTFKWVYAKDGSVSDGEDCAWIDYILFPPNIKIIQSLIEVEAASGLAVYPNPASGFTTINFAIDNPGNVFLLITDIQGKTIDVLLNNEIRNTGTYTLLVNLAKYRAGAYHIVLRNGNETMTREIIITK